MSLARIHFTVEFQVPAERREEFKTLARRLASEVEATEPDTVAYCWYFDANEERCRVREIFETSEAMIAHVQAPAVAEILPQLLEIAPLTVFEVYGDLSPEAEEAVAELGPLRYGTFTGFMR